MTKEELKILSLSLAARSYAYGRLANRQFASKWLAETKKELLLLGACPIIQKGGEHIWGNILSQ